VERGARDRGARAPPRAARRLSRAGAFLARGDLRSCVGSRRPGRRGGASMNGGAWLATVVLAAFWPFNRDRAASDEPVTIESLESRVVEVDVDAEIPASVDKAVESYREFLELASDDPVLRAEAMRRLADLEIEIAEEAGDGAREALSGSVELYLELLESYPDYAKNDLVLYQLARAYEARGDMERAVETLERLVNEYPNAAHYDEAQFRRGEA